MPGVMRAGMVRKIHGGVVLFDPSTVSGLGVWLKADEIGLADGTAVQTWSNEGSGADASQATSGKRPTFQTNEQNKLGDRPLRWHRR